VRFADRLRIEINIDPTAAAPMARCVGTNAEILAFYDAMSLRSICPIGEIMKFEYSSNRSRSKGVSITPAYR
jgi:hypothetical protein